MKPMISVMPASLDANDYKWIILFIPDYRCVLTPNLALSTLTKKVF